MKYSVEIIQEQYAQGFAGTGQGNEGTSAWSGSESGYEGINSGTNMPEDDFSDHFREGAGAEQTDRSAFNQLSDYMNEHNYGPDDFERYSKDPEWRNLERQAFPEYELPPAADTPAEAFDRLSDYMADHNYGPDDFATYSQDPAWRELQASAGTWRQSA